MRVDLVRSLAAGAAAMIVALAAVASYADDGMSWSGEAARVFAVEAAIAATLAVWPSRGAWGARRRALAGAIARVTGLCGPLILVLTSARSACGCGNPASGYVLFRLAGLGAWEWVTMAVVAYPLLIASASLLPSGLLPRRRNPAPPAP
jgi:hypothetical protein